MILHLKQIGRSKYLKLPTSILNKYQIQDKVELIFKDDRIIIKTLNPRKNWDEAFKQMRENGDDQLFIDDVFIDEFIVD